LPAFLAQTGLAPDAVFFSAITINSAQFGRMIYFLARPVLRGVNGLRTADPDQWWICDAYSDADSDEGSTWRQRGTISATGRILWDGEEGGGGWPLPLAGPLVIPTGEGGCLILAPTVEDDEEEWDNGDIIGTPPPPRPNVPRASPLPQGNSSVRDGVYGVRGLNARDATIEDDGSTSAMLGTRFMGRTPSRAYAPEAEAQEPPLPIDPDSVDLQGRPLRATPSKKPKTVYDHMQANIADLRAARPAPSVWDRLAAQRKKKAEPSA
jgi:hypothetical protein